MMIKVDFIRLYEHRIPMNLRKILKVGDTTILFMSEVGQFRSSMPIK